MIVQIASGAMLIVIAGIYQVITISLRKALRRLIPAGEGAQMISETYMIHSIQRVCFATILE